jgi:hypothetical protein
MYTMDDDEMFPYYQRANPRLLCLTAEIKAVAMLAVQLLLPYKLNLYDLVARLFTQLEVWHFVKKHYHYCFHSSQVVFLDEVFNETGELVPQRKLDALTKLALISNCYLDANYRDFNKVAGSYFLQRFLPRGMKMSYT